MTVQVRIRNALVAGLFFISAGGAGLHAVIHPASKFGFGLVPLVTGVLSALVIPWLFLSKRTLHLGYLLNGFAVIVGSVTMAHFALVSRPIWPDIPILWAKFALGYALFHLQSFPAAADYSPGWKTIRYPHFGFWVWHLMSVATVYTLGRLLWS